VSEFLPSALAAFLADHPPVNIDLREHSSLDIVRAVHEGKTDIGIVAGHVSTAGLETLPYFEDHLLLAVPRGHPLANRRRMPFADAIAFDSSVWDRKARCTRSSAASPTSMAGTLKIRIHVGSYDAMCRMIESGVGIGLLAESAGPPPCPHHRHPGLEARRRMVDPASQDLRSESARHARAGARARALPRRQRDTRAVAGTGEDV
jgi:DNA-binding transcriptional LysR family regulator